MTTQQDRLRAELRAAGDEFKAARATHATTQEQVVARAVAALKGGLGVVEVATLSGYTRENIRVIARKNGIEPK